MKIYKVSNIRRPGREHDGFEYFSSKAAAIKKQNNNETIYVELFGDDDDEGEVKEPPWEKDTIMEYDILLTKKEILRFLNAHASYPDNG